MEWTVVLVCVGVFLVFNAAAVCVFWAACVVMDEAENEFDESEGEGMEGWQLADNPPSTGRLVMLRFAPHGRKSTVVEQIGFFWRVSGGHYAFRKDGPFRNCSCHPTHWRELREGEGRE